MDARELQGKAVVSLSDATRLGRVADVLFDTDRLRVAGLRVSDEGGDYVLPFDDIASVGPDAITVEAPGAVRRGGVSGSVDQLPGLEALTHLKVVDESGTYQGTVHSIDVDASTGELAALELQKGGIGGIGANRHRLPPDAIRSIGSDVMTIRTPG